jgi:hypothetical protein
MAANWSLQEWNLLCSWTTKKLAIKLVLNF